MEPPARDVDLAMTSIVRAEVIALVHACAWLEVSRGGRLVSKPTFKWVCIVCACRVTRTASVTTCSCGMHPSCLLTFKVSSQPTYQMHRFICKGELGYAPRIFHNAVQLSRRACHPRGTSSWARSRIQLVDRKVGCIGNNEIRYPCPHGQSRYIVFISPSHAGLDSISKSS